MQRTETTVLGKSPTNNMCTKTAYTAPLTRISLPPPCTVMSMGAHSGVGSWRHHSKKKNESKSTHPSGGGGGHERRIAGHPIVHMHMHMHIGKAKRLHTKYNVGGKAKPEV